MAGSIRKAVDDLKKSLGGRFDPAKHPHYGPGERGGQFKPTRHAERAAPQQSGTGPGRVQSIPLSQIEPDQEQHRKRFPKEYIQELADGIREIGLQTPIVVRPNPDPKSGKKYRIVAGECRFRASKLAGKKHIRAEVKNLTDEEALTLQVVENIARKQVEPMEEADAYRQLYDQHQKKHRKATDEESRAYVVRQTGKSGQHVAYYLKLTALPEEPAKLVRSGALSPHHGVLLHRLIDGVEDPAELKERKLHQARMARYCVAQGVDAKTLNGQITAYLGTREQQTMFSDVEVSGGERQEQRRHQKAKLDAVYNSIADAINKAFDEKQGGFRPDLLTAGDLAMNLQKLEGGIETLNAIVAKLKEEEYRRGAVEATKRRVVNRADDIPEPQTQTGLGLFDDDLQKSLLKAQAGLALLQTLYSVAQEVALEKGVSRQFHEEQHPRNAKGERGGQFTKNPTSEGGTSEKQPNRKEYDLAARQQQKFFECMAVKKQLPTLIRGVAKDLQASGTPREKVAGTVAMLIKTLNMRVGSERYAERHGTFGASSLRTEHVTVDGDTIRFQFTGKKQVEWDRELTDPTLAKFIQHLKDGSPDGRLFWYHDEAGKQKPLTDAHVRDYLKAYDVTPKAFRTYTANLRLFAELQKRQLPEGAKQSDVKRKLAEALTVVASELGHDPGTCKTSYVFEPLWREFMDNGGRLTIKDAFEKGPLVKSLRGFRETLRPVDVDNEKTFGAWMDEWAQDPQAGALVKAHFTPEEMKSMGLRWVTAHPAGPGTDGVPIIVKDLGDGEAMVMGGAGNKLNYTRFKVPEGGFSDKKKKKEKKEPPPDLSDEETAALQTAQDHAKQLRLEQEQKLSELIQERFGERLGTMTQAERERVAKKAEEKADKLNATPDEKQELVDQAVKEHEKTVKNAGQETIAQIANAAIKAEALKAATGVDHEVSAQYRDAEGNLVKLPITAEDAHEVAAAVFEVRRAKSEERAVTKALKRGDPKAIRAVELLTTPLNDVQLAKLCMQEHYDREAVMVNNALADRGTGEGRMTRDAASIGAVEAGAGMAADVAGETVLHPEIAKKLGITGSARVMAHYLRQHHDGDAIAEAIQTKIATEGMATAATAVADADRTIAFAEDLKRFGKGGEKLMEGAQAGGKAVSALNEAKRLCARALGGLETMAQTAALLKQGVTGDMDLPGRSSKLGTLQMALDLGLDKGDFIIRSKEGGGFMLSVKEAALDKLADPKPIEGWTRDAEILDIKERGRGAGWRDETDPDRAWRAKGQGEGVILSPHQQADIKFWDKQKRIVVGDEAGSGKTAVILCGIAHLAAQGKVKKALVVVPKSVMEQMAGKPKAGQQNEAEKFLGPELAKSVIAVNSDYGHGPAKRKELYQGDQLITVVTHDTIRYDAEALKAAGFQALAVDEAHYFTSRDSGEASARTKMLQELQPEYVCLLTGTPVKNDLAELHSLVDYAQPGLLGDKKEFMAKYGKLGESIGPMDNSTKRALQAKLDGCFIGHKMTTVRNEAGQEVLSLKGEPGSQPVSMRHVEEKVELSPAQREAYREAEKQYLADKNAKKKGAAFARETKLKKAVNNMGAANNPKVAKLKELMDRHDGEAVIVFATNDYAVRTAIEGLGLNEEDYGKIDGSVSAGKRSKLAKTMNEGVANGSLKPRVLFCTDAANFGMNIQGASVVVNWDTPDTQATVEQRLARAFRRGQKRDVSVYHVRTDSPVEAVAARRLDKKRKRMREVDSLSHADETGKASTLLSYLKTDAGGADGGA